MYTVRSPLFLLMGSTLLAISTSPALAENSGSSRPSGALRDSRNSDTGSDAKTYLYTTSVSFSANTGYRKMTGLSGALFGHWSRGDEINVIEGAQKQLVRDLRLLNVNLDKVTFLPVELASASTRLVDTWNRTKDGWFGKKITHIHGKFKTEGRVRLAFLHRGELDLPGMEKHQVKGARLELSEAYRSGANRAVAEVQVPLSNLRLGAFSKSTAGEMGRLDVPGSVPESYRYTLADRVKNRKALKGMNLAAVVNLDLANGYGVQRITLQEGNRLFSNSDLLKALKIKGIKRFFSKGYYQHKLGPWVAKARKVLPKWGMRRKISR